MPDQTLSETPFPAGGGPPINALPAGVNVVVNTLPGRFASFSRYYPSGKVRFVHIIVESTLPGRRRTTNQRTARRCERRCEHPSGKVRFVHIIVESTLPGRRSTTNQRTARGVNVGKQWQTDATVCMLYWIVKP